MPNWASCSLEVDNADEFWEKIESVGEAIDDAGTLVVKNLFGLFQPMPKELEEIKTGSTTIDGVRFTKWRVEPDGENVGLTPKDELTMLAKYGYTDWYDWAVSNWGTKWDTDATAEERHRLRFDSAWAPPRGFVAYLSKLYPQATVRIAYAEGGMGFWGVEEWVDGEERETLYGESMYMDDVNWDVIEDSYEALLPEVQDHLDTYSLHMGG